MSMKLPVTYGPSASMIWSGLPMPSIGVPLSLALVSFTSGVIHTCSEPSFLPSKFTSTVGSPQRGWQTKEYGCTVPARIAGVSVGPGVKTAKPGMSEAGKASPATLSPACAAPAAPKLAAPTASAVVAPTSSVRRSSGVLSAEACTGPCDCCAATEAHARPWVHTRLRGAESTAPPLQALEPGSAEGLPGWRLGRLAVFAAIGKLWCQRCEQAPGSVGGARRAVS
eukprot:scaffold459_cov391-Prasinococcus_capsulatus_cf.AAC.8